MASMMADCLILWSSCLRCGRNVMEILVIVKIRR